MSVFASQQLRYPIESSMTKFNRIDGCIFFCRAIILSWSIFIVLVWRQRLQTLPIMTSRKNLFSQHYRTAIYTQRSWRLLEIDTVRIYGRLWFRPVHLFYFPPDARLNIGGIYSSGTHRYLCRSNAKIEGKSKIFSTFDTLTPNRTSGTHKPVQDAQERPATTLASTFRSPLKPNPGALHRKN